MIHPTETNLALFAGGELGTWRRWQVSRHASQCEQCRSEIEEFRAARSRIRAAAETLPAGVNWNRMASEMKANIHLGLAAGACVTPVEAPRRTMNWRFAGALASVTVLAAVGWWLEAPAPKVAKIPDPAAILERTASGIRYQENGHAFTLMGPKSEPVNYSVSAQGAMQAAYVDDSGQVTVNLVYAAQ